MGLSGLEPPTSRLSGVRSNRLSYKPISFDYLKPMFGKFLFRGGDKRDRTVDPLLAKQVLSQLSYTPIILLWKSFFQGPSKLNNTLNRTRNSDLGFDDLFHSSFLHRKEVIQPHLPIRLPCYDFTPVANPTFGSVLLAVELLTSGITGSHGVTGGVYKARERIHRDILIRDY